jgi:hypothetical protein
VKSPQKINKIKKHDVPDLYRFLHRIRFYLEFCLQFRQHGNVSIIKMWSLVNWTRIVSERGLVKISVIETDTATSGLHWIFHMHLEFSRPAMCNNTT